MMLLTPDRLRAFLPSLADPAAWVAALSPACVRFEIDTPGRLAAFLAQVAHESGELHRLVEQLNYTAARLMVVWPSRFPTLASAQPYEHQPEKLANHVYANRNGNGDEASGDGWTYRGRGLFQLTGRLNYRTAGTRIQLPLEQEPNRVAEPAIAAMTAGSFWSARSLNRLADMNTENAFDEISQRINGGTQGLAERRAYWIRAKEALAA